MSQIEVTLKDRYGQARANLMGPAPRRKPIRLPVTQPEPVEAPVVGLLSHRVNRVVHDMCQKYRVTEREITSDNRSFLVTLARDEVCWRLRTTTSLSLPQIGARVGGRDHTTVLMAIRRYEWRFVKGAQQ